MQTSNGLLPSEIATLADLGTNSVTIHRWRKKLWEDRDYEAAHGINGGFGCCPHNPSYVK